MTTTTTATQSTALQILDSVPNGQIFTVTFRKRSNGETRTMNCRKGVTKHLRGGTLSYTPTNRGLLTVFDMQAGEYRMINLLSLISIKTGGETYNVG